MQERIAEEQTMARIDVIQPPKFPAVTIKPNRARQLLLVVVALGISGGVVLLAHTYRHELRDMGHAGYLGLFIISIIGNATVFIPAPVFAFACAAGSALDPFWVGVTSGGGSAIGELTGYVAGYGGNAVIPHGKLYERLHGFVDRRGALTIFVLAAIPNPVFDAGGMIAGALRMPVSKFLLAAWLGKALRLGLMAYGCSTGVPWLMPR